MASDSEMRALRTLIDLIDRADALEADESTAEGISRRLATFYGRPDLRERFRGQIRKTVSGRLVTGGLKSPKVVFVVMDQGVAVLGGFDWSGFMRTESVQTDLTAKWSDVNMILFKFPAWLGGIGIERTDRIITETGPFEIAIATPYSRVMRIVPDGNVTAFAGAARATAALLGSLVEGEEPSSDETGANSTETLIAGLLRYIPEPWDKGNMAAVDCTFDTMAGGIPGIAVIAHKDLWLFSHETCLVPDLEDGDFTNHPVADMHECTVTIPPDIHLPNYRNVNVLRTAASMETLTIDLDDTYSLSVPADKVRGIDGEAGSAQNIADFLRLIDQFITPWEDL